MDGLYAALRKAMQQGNMLSLAAKRIREDQRQLRAGAKKGGA